MDKKQIILLKKFNLPDEDKIYKMHELVCNYFHTFHDADHMDEIKLMKEDTERAFSKFNDAYFERYTEVEELLLKYWKVSKIDYKGNRTPVMFIFPYKLIDTNRCLFTLCSYIKPEYNSNNGLHEESFDIMNAPIFKNNDLLFEEATEEEIMNNAKKSCEDALSERLWKLKYRDNVLD